MQGLVIAVLEFQPLSTWTAGVVPWAGDEDSSVLRLSLTSTLNPNRTVVARVARDQVNLGIPKPPFLGLEGLGFRVYRVYRCL